MENLRLYTREQLEYELKMTGKVMTQWLRDVQKMGRITYRYVYMEPHKSAKRERRYYFLPDQLELLNGI